MLTIKQVYISDNLIHYLEKRNLDTQYKKTKSYILSGNYRQVKLKLREPKKDGVFYFRINKQYRALCYRDWSTLKIFDIDNHQN